MATSELTKDCEETPEERELKEAFVLACQNGDILKFQKLLQIKELNINCLEGCALYWAVLNNHIPIWKTLLERPDIELNYTDYNGNNLLHWSCYLNYGNITRKLLKLCGEGFAIKCNLKNAFGNTPLMEAALNGSMQSLKVMLACPKVKLVVVKHKKDIVEAILGNVCLEIQNLIRYEKSRRKTEVLKKKEIKSQIIKHYACLNSDCHEIFLNWGCALRHMKEGGHYLEKALIANSLAKADILQRMGSTEVDGSEKKLDEKQVEMEGASKGKMSNNYNDSINTNLNDDAVTTIERQYISGKSTMARLKEMGGEVVENMNYTDLFYDTEDFLLLRKGIQLRKRVEESLEVWQIMYLHEGGRKLARQGGEDVKSRLGEALGESGSLEEMVVQRLVEISRMQGKVVSCKLGKVEFKLLQEEAMETISIQLVGDDVLATLLDLDNLAKKLKLMSCSQSRLMSMAETGLGLVQN